MARYCQSVEVCCKIESSDVWQDTVKVGKCVAR